TTSRSPRKRPRPSSRDGARSAAGRDRGARLRHPPAGGRGGAPPAAGPRPAARLPARPAAHQRQPEAGGRGRRARRGAVRRLRRLVVPPAPARPAAGRPVRAADGRAGAAQHAEVTCTMALPTSRYSRVTLVGARRRVDLLLPSGEPVGLLMPDLLELAGESAAAPPRIRQLVRANGDVLAEDASLAQAGVEDG